MICFFVGRGGALKSFKKSSSVLLKLVNHIIFREIDTENSASLERKAPPNPRVFFPLTFPRGEIHGIHVNMLL